MVEQNVHLHAVAEQRGNRLSPEDLVGKMREQSANNRPLTYHPILTRSQEQMLFRELRGGNDTFTHLMAKPHFSQFMEEISEKDGEKWASVLANNETITGVIAACNQRLVINEAKKYINRNRDINDIIGGGTNGLLDAIERFDVDKGTRFFTYSRYHITAGIQKAIRDSDGISLDVHRGMAKNGRIQEAFIAVFKREPTREELRQQLLVHTEYSIKTIEEVLDRRNTLSLNQKTSKSNTNELYEVISDSSIEVEESALDRVEQHERSMTIGNAIVEHLGHDEKFVLESMFGLAGKEKQSVDAVARGIQKNTDEVLSLLNKALVKLQGDNKIQVLGKADGFVTPPQTIDEKKSEKIISQQGVIFEADKPLIDKIKYLRLQNYNTQQIVDILGVSGKKVKYLVAILLRQGEVPLLHTKREQEREAARSDATEAIGKYLMDHPPLFLGRPTKRSSKIIAFDENVKELKKNAELTNSEISEILGTTVSRVEHSILRLRTSGEIFPVRSPRERRNMRRRPETIGFDEKVKALRENIKLTQRQIAEKLGVSTMKVKRSIARLRVLGEISPDNHKERDV